MVTTASSGFRYCVMALCVIGTEAGKCMTFQKMAIKMHSEWLGIDNIRSLPAFCNRHNVRYRCCLASGGTAGVVKTKKAMWGSK